MAILAWIRPARDWPMVVALSVGVSVAFWPLLVLWSSLTGGRWTAGHTWLVVGFAVVTAVAGFARRDRLVIAAHHAFALLLIVSIALALRHQQAAPLVVPAWVDGLHHTEIMLRVMEEGALPGTLRPYMALDSFYYHFGFHVIAALVADAGGLEAERAVLVTGQLLSALACLSVYALARATRIRPNACLAAAAVPATLYWFPMYFVTWSRFTQLAGLVVLPAAWVLLGRAVRDPTPPRVAAAAVSAAGLVLVHYRVGVFYGLGVVAMLLVVAAKRRAFDRRRMRRGLGGLVATAAVALVLTLPWLANNVMGGARELSEATTASATASVNPIPDAVAVISAGGEPAAPPPSGGDGAAVERPWFQAVPGSLNVPRWLFVQRWNAVLLLAAGAGLAFAAVRRSAAAWWMIVTCVLATLVTSPDLIRLPASWLVPGFSAAISLWIPAGVGVAMLVDEVARRLARRPYGRRRIGVALAWGAVLATAVGVVDLTGRRPRVVQVVNASTVIALPADIEAARWIREHTPASARFLVSSGHWHLGTYRGLDGGYWLPVTAGRGTTMPGGLYSFGDPADVRAITAFAKRMEAGDGLSDDDLAGLMDDSGAEFVYVGPAGAGVVGKLTAARLSKVPFLSEVYASNGVHIFARR